MLAKPRAKRLVALDFVAVLGEQILGGLRRRPAGVTLLGEDAPEQSTHQRTPGDDADAVVERGRDDLLLHVTLDEVVKALLADQPEEVTSSRCLLGLRDRPAGEV